MITAGRVAGLIQAMGGGADPAVIEAKVEEWLDNHPEATTTVQDGSITEQKLATSIAQKLGLISSLSDEIDDIGSDVTDLKSAIGEIPVIFTDGKYISSGNYEVDNSTYSITNYISVIPNEKIHIKMYFHDNPRCVFVNETYAVVSVIQNTGSTNKYDEVITVPSNARYLRCSCLIANQADSVLEHVTNTISEPLINSMYKIGSLTNVIGTQHLSFTDGYYLNANNLAVSGNGYSYSDFIPVVENSKILIKTQFADSARIVFTDGKFNGSKFIIQALANSSGSTYFNDIVTVPVGAKYVRFSCYKAYKDHTDFQYIVAKSIGLETNKTVQNTPQVIRYEQGGTNVSGGFVNSSIRVRTIVPMFVPSGSRVNIKPNGQKCLGWFYKLTGNSYDFPTGYTAYYQLASSWIAFPYTMQTKEDLYAIFTVAKIDDSDIVPNDVKAEFTIISDENEKTVNRQRIKFESSNKIETVAHRGFTDKVPENTIPAILMAYANGFNIAEIDVQFTSDGVPVLLHDATINRTSNGTGEIANLSYDEVKALDFGSWCCPAYAGTKIPTFAELLQVIKSTGITVWIELKVGTEEQIDALVDDVIDMGLLDKVYWFSGYDALLTYVKTKAPNANFVFSISSVSPGTITYLQSLKEENNKVILSTDIVSSANVTACKNANIPMSVFLPNPTPTNVDAISEYVTYFLTDNANIGHYKYEKYMGLT